MSQPDQDVINRSTVHSTFVLERSYDAARSRVWRAWADPEEKLRWFGPREPAKPTHEFDFRLGGIEQMAVRTPDGARYTFVARYQDIVESERFVLTSEMYLDEQRISVSVVTVEFDTVGTATRLTLTEQGVYLDGLDTPEQREHGTRELLDSLASHLESEEGAA
jgi:uncharacterized protein YndB with AHSA1/START domain